MDRIEVARGPVLQVVSAIPSGRVATYGQVAALAGMPQQSRLVGRILALLPAGTRLPWHRVINSQGRISNPDAARQQDRLESEGIALVNGRVSLKHYQWIP